MADKVYRTIARLARIQDIELNKYGDTLLHLAIKKIDPRTIRIWSDL